MQEIISKLITKYHCKIIDITTFSVIASYKSQLEDIAKEYNCTLDKTHHLTSELSIQGIFTIN